MTLPTGAIAMSQVATEIGVSQAGLSLNHAWVRALAGAAASGPVAFSQLQGKSGIYNGSGQGGFNGTFMTFPSGNPPWFNGTLEELDAFGTGSGNKFTLIFASSPTYSGNIRVTNQSTGITGVFSPNGNPGQWDSSPFQVNMIRANSLDVYLIQPA